MDGRDALREGAVERVGHHILLPTVLVPLTRKCVIRAALVNMIDGRQLQPLIPIILVAVSLFLRTLASIRVHTCQIALVTVVKRYLVEALPGSLRAALVTARQQARVVVSLLLVL